MGTLHFQEVYGHDYELEKMLRDVGGHASKLAFIRGITSLLIDDEKMQSRSAKTNDISLSKFKSSKTYGVVGNCVNSVNLGIPLSCQYSHHGHLVAATPLCIPINAGCGCGCGVRE